MTPGAHPRPDRGPAARRRPHGGTPDAAPTRCATHLAPYRTWLAAIVVLQFVGVVAMLYLPSLNADIIDNGVATGDTGYIVRTGGVMLAVSLRADRLLGQRPSGSAPARRWASAATCARALFHRVGTFSAARGAAVRRARR